MNKEETFLNIISKTLDDSSFLGDDCAYLKEYNLAISTDALVEDVHFRLCPKASDKAGCEATIDTETEYAKGVISPYALGKKTLLVNISDILAAGAKPEYLTISLSGNLDTNFVEKFYKGVNETCKEYDLKIIGGDLTGGDKISISITIFGNTKNRMVSSRAAAKEGYVVLLAGDHGSSATGFSILNNTLDQLPSKQLLQKKCVSERLPYKEDVIKELKNEFVRAHFEPKLYPEISEIVATQCRKPYAMMDTSDGLYDALKKISTASNVGFSINYDKISKKCVAFEDGTTIPDFNTVLFGGEDYGLLICLDKDDFEMFKEKIIFLGAAEIGTVTKASGEILIDNKEIDEDLRFEHFE